MSTRRELVWVHDLSGAQVGVIGRDFREIHVDTTLDQAESLTFAIPANHPKRYLLAEDRELRLGTRTFYIDDMLQERNGAELVVKVIAPATWYRLGDHDHVGSLVVVDAAVDVGATAILAGTGWTVDARTISAGAFSMETQDRSALANVRTWAKITGTVVEFDTQARTVAWLASRGVDLGLAFRKGRNLRNVKRRRTPPRVTALYPYGRDDLTIAGINGEPFVEDASFYTAQGIDFDATAPDGRTYRERLGKRRVIRDQSFVKEADLLAWAQSELVGAAQSVQSVELDVVDIAEITGVTEELTVGDRCRAFDPDFGEEFAATVTRYVDHPLQPWRNEIELSTSPQVVADPDTSSGRPQQSLEWVLFRGPVQADFQIRNDSVWTVARIPLRFTEGGRAHYHLDLWMTGVDAGVAIIEVYEAESATVVRETLTVPYTNDERVRVHLTWAAEDLTGQHDYRVRVTTAAAGGASPIKGVDIGMEGDGTAAWYILAQGAVQETPTEPNSVTFDYTGAVQRWIVPDNVTGPITITATGGKGGRSGGGNGGRVIATFPSVIPGETFDIYVGNQPAGILGPWPNGGAPGAGTSAGITGGAGGGASFVTPFGGSLLDALVVAPGGGGASVDQAGGQAGFFIASDGATGSATGGTGATQFAPGVGGVSGGSGGDGTDGDIGEQGRGGSGGNGGGSLGNSGGGGGGGWRGGGGGGGRGSVNGDGPGGGGGGSGMIREDGYDISVSDGANTGHGQITISWETPATV